MSDNNRTSALLRNEGLRLRPLEMEDMDLVYQLENDTRLWDSTNTINPYSKEVIAKYIASQTGNILVDEELRLVVDYQGQSIGLLDFTSFTALHQRTEIGMVILPEYQGTGLGTQVMQLAIEYARKRLHLKQIYSIVPQPLKASIRMHEKTGFSKVATLPEWFRQEDGGFCDAIVLQLILSK